MTHPYKRTIHVERSNLLLQLSTLHMALLVLLLGPMFSACSSNVSSNSSNKTPANNTPQANISLSTTPIQTAKTYPVKVYFSKSPESNNDFNAVFPVDRVSPTVSVATFAIQQLIIGPTPSEHRSSYFSELSDVMGAAPSACHYTVPAGSPNFTLTMNKKGSIDEQGTATLKFRRMLCSPGIGADARMKAEINATLKQFANIKKVVILTMDDHCLGDESGKDLCLA